MAAVLAAIGPMTQASAEEAAKHVFSNGVIVSVGGGYSHLDYGDSHFVGITDWFGTETIGHVEDYDGRSDGYRINGEVSGLFKRMVRGHQMSFGVKGFYASYEGSQTSRCLFENLVSDCAVFPLFDPDDDLFPDHTGGFFSDFVTRTHVDVKHWGVAGEMRFSRSSYEGGGLKDAPVHVRSPLDWRLGIAVKRFDKDKRIYSEDFGPSLDPISLVEALNTTYYGVYGGVDYTHDLGHGFSLVLRGEAGIYHADTDYRGAYASTDTFGGPGLPLSQTLRLSDDGAAFIGSIGMEINKEIGRGVKLGVFGDVEYYSRAPNVRYNDTERSGGGVLDIVGRTEGSRLVDDHALSYTVGARVTVPLEGQ